MPTKDEVLLNLIEKLDTKIDSVKDKLDGITVELAELRTEVKNVPRYDKAQCAVHGEKITNALVLVKDVDARLVKLETNYTKTATKLAGLFTFIGICVVALVNKVLPFIFL